jgi:L-asparaginase
VLVRVLTTGGTIAQRLGEQTARHVPGSDLMAALADAAEPGAPAPAQVQTEDLFDLPSTYLGPGEMLVIAERVAQAAADPEVTGVVVTHGTATMEESVYFIDIVSGAAKPVVFTGAQRFPQSLGYDGYRNLAHAITVAQAPAARGLGTVLVMDGEIHAARDVTEIHPSSAGGFHSVGYGPIGRVESGQVVIGRQPVRDSPVPGVRRPLARVDLLTTYAGMTGDVLLAVAELGAGGIVLDGMTTGAVPVGLVAAVRELVQGGIVVAVGTRCPGGGVLRRGDLYRGVAGYGPDLDDLGVVLTGLSGVKARLRLTALLSSGLSPAAARDRMRAPGQLDGG